MWNSNAFANESPARGDARDNARNDDGVDGAMRGGDVDGDERGGRAQNFARYERDAISSGGPAHNRTRQDDLAPTRTVASDGLAYFSAPRCRAGSNPRQPPQWQT